MDDHPSTTGSLPDDPLTALAAQYPGWQLCPAPPGFAAEHTSADGRHIRYVVARSVRELAARMAAIEMSQA